MKTESGAGQIASVNEIEMYYEIRGEGQPLVLLHGFTGAGSDWRYMATDRETIVASEVA